jgi:hypothetical protein
MSTTAATPITGDEAIYGAGSTARLTLGDRLASRGDYASNGSCQFPLIKRLLQHNGIGAVDNNRRPTDEEVRYWSRTQNFADGSHTTAVAEATIDDHQLRLPRGRRSHRSGLSRGDATDIKPHLAEHFGEQGPNNRIVLGHENTNAAHFS